MTDFVRFRIRIRIRPLSRIFPPGNSRDGHQRPATHGGYRKNLADLNFAEYEC